MKTTMTAMALLIAMALHAQQWHFGPQVNADFTHIDGNGMRNGFTAGFEAGGFINHIWKNKWGIQPELLFTQSNSRKADDFLMYYVNSGNISADDNTRLSYITLPLLARYDVSEMVTVLAGPEYSYLVFDNETLRQDNGNAFKNSAFSADLGAQLNISPVHLYARYNRGISNVNNIDGRYAWRPQHIRVGMAVSIR